MTLTVTIVNRSSMGRIHDVASYKFNALCIWARRDNVGSKLCGVHVDRSVLGASVARPVWHA